MIGPKNNLSDWSIKMKTVKVTHVEYDSILALDNAINHLDELRYGGRCSTEESFCATESIRVVMSTLVQRHLNNELCMYCYSIKSENAVLMVVDDRHDVDDCSIVTYKVVVG